MKTFLRTLLLLTLITPASMVLAHSDHSTIDAQSAIQIASKSIQQMTFKDLGYQAGKLDANWKAVPIEDIEVIDFREGVYVLSAANKATNKSLYLKITVTGQLLEAIESNED